MNAQEMQQKFKMLYDTMAMSRKTENMKLFGSVMCDMMRSAIQKNPSDAQEWIEELGAIEWNNYLTPKEAEKIVSEMPDAPWSREVWNKALDGLELEKEDKPYFNSCALWVEMNHIYCTHAKSLAKILGRSLNEIGTDELVRSIYMLALDNLKGDNSISIRHRYGL